MSLNSDFIEGDTQNQEENELSQTTETSVQSQANGLNLWTPLSIT